MAGKNLFIGMGHLGRDPELRYTTNGTPVVSLRLACTRKFYVGKGDDAKLQEETLWIQCSAWGRRAEVAAKYLSKGSPVLVEARLRNTEWEDKDGVKRYGIEAVATDVQLLGSGNKGDRPPHPATDDRGGPGGYVPTDEDAPMPGDDDFPG